MLPCRSHYHHQGIGCSEQAKSPCGFSCLAIWETAWNILVAVSVKITGFTNDWTNLNMVEKPIDLCDISSFQILIWYITGGKSQHDFKPLKIKITNHHWTNHRFWKKIDSPGSSFCFQEMSRHFECHSLLLDIEQVPAELDKWCQKKPILGLPQDFNRGDYWGSKFWQSHKIAVAAVASTGSCQRCFLGTIAVLRPLVPRISVWLVLNIKYRL